jgi:hypothetical protein
MRSTSNADADKTAKEKSAAHERRKIKMQILTRRNDSPELHRMGGDALESNLGHAKRSLLNMMEKDGPTISKDKKKEKEKELEMEMEEKKKAMKRSGPSMR